jgi:hypothetical protein
MMEKLFLGNPLVFNRKKVDIFISSWYGRMVVFKKKCQRRTPKRKKKQEIGENVFGGF